VHCQVLPEGVQDCYSSCRLRQAEAEAEAACLPAGLIALLRC
jgi:hypothetical protein